MKTATIVKRLAPSLGKPGLSTRRAIDIDDIKICVKKTKDAKRRVRVYSSQGFVPNKYGYRCEIQYVEATKVTDNLPANVELSHDEIISDGWYFRVGWSGAARSNARGPLVVVQ